MSVTRPDVVIPNATWVDLYAGSGISVGTAVTVINKGNYPCQLVIKATAPTDTSLGFPLPASDKVGNYAYVAASEVGLWAYCPQRTTRLLVQE